MEVSKKGLLSLNLDEMRTIAAYFRNSLREPTDVELETIAQTWSEHCSHKTFRATINYREVDSDGNVLEEERIAGLLKQYLMRATEKVKQDWLVSAFSDNAGIIRFTEREDIAFKVETHNHPSAIEPFGGANTGVGGVIRDVLGVSAQPIACTDILCFGPSDTPVEDLPVGILSPRRIASGVINGVRDYGNKMGIPTVNGAILYNEGYLYNPLVFCGCLGILPHGSHPHNVRPGNRIVVLGGRTGRDGVHGATFSSGEMSREINAQAGTAVQIGAPITEKKVTDVIIQARDRGLYTAITDCGAGGFSSAIGEMGEETGAYIELEKAPLKYQGLAPWEIWLSEAQERMVLAVPPEHIDELLDLCELEEVEASVIGTFTDDQKLTVTYDSQTVAHIDMEFLHNGRPNRTLDAVWIRKNVSHETKSGYRHPGPGHPQGDAPTIHGSLIPDRIGSHGFVYSRGIPLWVPWLVDRLPWNSTRVPWLGSAQLSWNSTLLSLLSHPNIASKETVIRRYDHEVQGATVLKPLVGRAGNGPGDAAVLKPILGQQTKAGIVLSNGINPLYGRIDPYAMAMNAVDEALRNLTAVGGDIDRAAILDNFCWGNPSDPSQLGMLVRAVKGCYDAAIGFGTPFISGKDSLNNEYRADGERLPVIPTLLISAVGAIDDAEQTVDMSLKKPGNALYLIGTTRNELAESHYAALQEQSTFEQLFPATNVPQVDVAHARTTMKAVGQAIRKGLVQSCHDLSEGGLAVAAAEMSLAGLLGMIIDIPDQQSVGADLPRPSEVSTIQPSVGADSSRPDVGSTILLFSETPSRFLLEIAPHHQEAFETHMTTSG
ncbi:MAG: AIR synthase-related protein, partial [Chloroflexota bacterium]|nr:AIR synthase-related protein [Chloroflexota bacterium]